MIAAAFLAAAFQAAACASCPAPDATVEAFVRAYNRRDFAAMEAALAPDAKWYSVEGAKVSVDGDGRDAIVEWTRAYLGKTCTTCRSTLLSVGVSGRFVTTVERASWTNKAGACVSQTGPAVYELADGRIRAVWYFAASAQAPCERGG